MGSGDWFKAILSSKKVKGDNSRKTKGTSTDAKSNGFKWRSRTLKGSTGFSYGSTSGNPGVLGIPVEDIAATRIQTAFRAFMARKTLRRLKGIVRLQKLTQGNCVRKQASTTLSYLSSWSRIQTQIRARRLCMVTEGRIRQKKLENQLKLDAKLHDLEVEWCGGPETMEEILARIYHREEAAVKRERALAYAFSHQWRANSGQNQGPNKSGLSKANWGWSWMERWIAARPWESRVHISPKKAQSRQKNKVGKNIISPKTKVPVTVNPNGKGTTKARRLSYPSAEKRAARDGNIKPEEVNAKEEQPVP